MILRSPPIIPCVAFYEGTFCENERVSLPSEESDHLRFIYTSAVKGGFLSSTQRLLMVFPSAHMIRKRRSTSAPSIVPCVLRPHGERLRSTSTLETSHLSSRSRELCTGLVTAVPLSSSDMKLPVSRRCDAASLRTVSLYVYVTVVEVKFELSQDKLRHVKLHCPFIICCDLFKL